MTRLSESLQQPLQQCDFGGLRVEWVEGVIEPRQWTLAQSQWAAERSSFVPQGRVLELFAGAGHIGQEAARLSGRSVLQVDIDPVSSSCAVLNAKRNGLESMAEQLCADVSALSLDDLVANGFPLALVDAPYVPSEDCAQFPEDPLRAIDGGADGLDLTRAALRLLDSVLMPDGEAVVQLRSVRQVQILDGSPGSHFRAVEVREVSADRVLALFCRAGVVLPNSRCA